MFSDIFRFGILVSLWFFDPSKIDGDQIFLLHFLIAVVILSSFSKKLREVDFRLLGVFYLSALLSLCFNFHWPSRLMLLNLFVGVQAIKIVAEYYDFDVKKTGLTLLSFCWVNVAFIILQHFKLDPHYYPYFNEIAGTMWRPWMLGCAAVLSIPFIAAVSPVLLIFVAPLLLFCQSKICVFAAVVSALVAFRVKPTLIRIGTSVLIVGLYVVFADVNFEWTRFTIWLRSSRYIHSSLYGNGIGAWAHEGFIRWNGLTPEHWVWAHNEFYQVFFEQGGFGFISLAIFLGSLIFNNRRNSIKMSVITALIILSLFHPIFRFGKLLGLCVLSLSYLLTPEKLGSQSVEHSKKIS